MRYRRNQPHEFSETTKAVALIAAVIIFIAACCFCAVWWESYKANTWANALKRNGIDGANVVLPVGGGGKR